MGRFRDTENKDYQTQFLVLVSILLTLIANSSSMDVRNIILTKGTYATINCTYGEGEVRNLFWYHGNCSEEPPMPWIVRYFKGSVISSDETRFDLEDDNSTLILKNVSIEDEGTYCCSVDIKGGTLNPNTFLTRVDVFGLDSKTLPVIPQCQEDDHDDLNSTTCTLNAPTNLTCVLHGVYPNRSVKLAWHDDEGTISSIFESYSNDDVTYTFIATIHVSEAGSFWCNASFPSEAGLAETGVSVTVLVPVHRPNNVPVIVGSVVAFVFIIMIIVIVVYCCICKQHHTKNSDGGSPKEQGTGRETTRQIEEGSDGRLPDAQGRGDEPTEQIGEESVPLVDVCAGAGGSAPDGSDDRLPDAQGRGDETTEQIGEATPESVPLVQVCAGAGGSAPDGTNQEVHHTTDASECTAEITERQLLNLSQEFPHGRYTALCLELGISYNKCQNILSGNQSDYMEAFTKVLMDWKNKNTAVCHVLCAALKKVDMGGLQKLIHIQTASSVVP